MSHETRRRPDAYAGYVLAILSLTYIVNFLDRQILSIQDIKADLRLDDAQLGFLYGTAFAIFYALFGIPLGRMADIWFRTRLIALGLALWSSMTSLSGLATSFWDSGVPEDTLNDPPGWSTLPKLIVYHLEQSVKDQLAQIGLETRDIDRVAISHTHGDHIGNVGLFPDATILMQRAEHHWIHSTNGSNDNVNQLKALARKLMGTPENLQLIDGDTDVFGDGSVTLVATPGHTPGHQSLLLRLRNSCFIILSGDVAHLEENFEHDVVPSLNTSKPESIASMDRSKQLISMYQAKFFINHDKSEADGLKLLPEYYD